MTNMNIECHVKCSISSLSSFRLHAMYIIQIYMPS